jgi:hypothetical protein
MEAYKFDIHDDADNVIWSRTIIASGYSEAAKIFYKTKDKPDGARLNASLVIVPDGQRKPKTSINIVKLQFGYCLKIEGRFVKITPRAEHSRLDEIELVKSPSRMAHPLPMSATIWTSVADLRKFWSAYRKTILNKLKKQTLQQEQA